jgi:iron-sulfur cluster assembly protein
VTGVQTCALPISEQVKKQLTKRGTPDAYLRLGIRGGACEGFSYAIQFEDADPKDRDLLFEIEGVHILVDKKSIIYLNGCTLDYESSLMKQGFKFINPNEKSKCSCGNSFSA